MFRLPDLDIRKEHTKVVIQRYERFLDKIIKNKKIKANLTFFLHILIVVVPFFILIFRPVDIYFYISLILWILIVFLHFYFNGCIFIRIERELMEDKTWKGIWTYIFYIFDYFKISVTNNISNYLFISWGVNFTIFILFKLLLHVYPSIISYIIKWISMLFLQKNITISYSDVETNVEQLTVGNYGIIFAIAIGSIFFTPYLDTLCKRKIDSNREKES